MTPVFGHGRLRLYLLKLLDESPRHGYEIIQQLRERFAGLYAPSAGTVYPRLARLESEGLVRHRTDGGRKIYQITEAGRAELAARAAELEALESEIRDSVRELADSIRDEVRESARTVREELQNQVRETQRAARGGPAPSASAGFPADPPPESAAWNREQWRDWKRGQQERWRIWKEDQKDRDPWKDWQRAWKEQWARQWKEQWEEQLRRGWTGGPPPPWTSWAFGNPPGGSDDVRPQDAARPGPEWHPDWSRWSAEWERFGPQLHELFGTLRHDAGPLAEAARRHGPLSQEELTEVRAILRRTLGELRDVFDGRGGQRPTE
jgi:DNA-binding PadR family transcriptional regulator